MAVVRWTFYDPGTDETWQVPLNPSDGGSPGYKRNFTYQNTSAPDGKTLVFEGRADPQTLEFSGTLLTEAHLATFVEWWEKRNQILITDDLFRQFWVVIEEFSPKRKRAIHYPWRHEYTVKATIVDWPS